MLAWNGWYHVNGNTYGTWLRGDSRGWRARHHREHVDGDYKDPPPAGTYDRLLARSRWLMTREPVHLSGAARKLACRVMVESLRRDGVEVIALCVDDHHFHLLARFPKPRGRLGEEHKPSDRPGEMPPRSKIPTGSENCSTASGAAGRSLGLDSRYAARKDGNVELAVIRQFVGAAKRDSARELVAAQLASPGGVWAVRCRALPVEDRGHQLSVYRYIAGHGERGAAVWTIADLRDGAER